MQFIRYSTKIKTSRRHVIAAAHLVTKVTKLCKVLIASRKVGAGSVHCTLCNRAVNETSNSAWRRQGAFLLKASAIMKRDYTLIMRSFNMVNRCKIWPSPVGTVKLRKGWLAALLFACSVGWQAAVTPLAHERGGAGDKTVTQQQ